MKTAKLNLKIFLCILTSLTLTVLISVSGIKALRVNATDYIQNYTADTPLDVPVEYTAKSLPSFLSNTQSIQLTQSSNTNTHPTSPLSVSDSFKTVALTNDILYNNLNLSETEKAYLLESLQKPKDTSKLDLVDTSETNKETNQPTIIKTLDEFIEF